MLRWRVSVGMSVLEFPLSTADCLVPHTPRDCIFDFYAVRLRRDVVFVISVHTDMSETPEPRVHCCHRTMIPSRRRLSAADVDVLRGRSARRFAAAPPSTSGPVLPPFSAYKPDVSTLRRFLWHLVLVSKAAKSTRSTGLMLGQRSCLSFWLPAEVCVASRYERVSTFASNVIL